MKISPCMVMRPGLYLILALLGLCGSGLARADEVIRLCGPRAVGFIRTTAGQSCLYSSDTKPAPPDPNSAPQPAPKPDQPAGPGSAKQP